MAYNEKNVPGIGHLKNLAERLQAGYATKAELETAKGSIPTKVSQLTNDSGYQTEAQVAAQVAAADHLTRKKVDSVDAIDPAAEGADRIIYMVPKADSDEDDLYDEYMVLDGKVEHVGNTRMDLSGFVQKEEGKGLSSNDYTNEEKAKLAGLVMASDEEVKEMLDEVFGTAEGA